MILHLPHMSCQLSVKLRQQLIECSPQREGLTSVTIRSKDTIMHTNNTGYSHQPDGILVPIRITPTNLLCDHGCVLHDGICQSLRRMRSLCLQIGTRQATLMMLNTHT